MCPFEYTAVAVSGKVGNTVNRFNHTSWVAIVTKTDRPKSVRNSCVIEVFGGVFVLSCRVLDLCEGVGAFVIRLSQISKSTLSKTNSSQVVSICCSPHVQPG